MLPPPVRRPVAVCFSQKPHAPISNMDAHRAPKKAGRVTMTTRLWPATCSDIVAPPGHVHRGLHVFAAGSPQVAWRLKRMVGFKNLTRTSLIMACLIAWSIAVWLWMDALQQADAETAQFQKLFATLLAVLPAIGPARPGDARHVKGGDGWEVVLDQHRRHDIAGAGGGRSAGFLPRAPFSCGWGRSSPVCTMAARDEPPLASMRGGAASGSRSGSVRRRNHASLPQYGGSAGPA
jgi:hypothetical protein